MPRPAVLPALAAALLAAACAKGDTKPAAVVAEPGVVDVVARGLTFEAPATLPSGWTTFRFHNESDMVHFAVLDRLPPGKTIDDWFTDFSPGFQKGMDLIAAGKMDEAAAVFGAFPEWSREIVLSGGPGLTAAHHTSETTIRLEPGTYVMECYVKTGGRFHALTPTGDVRGMAVPITVTDAAGSAAEPVPTATLTISREGGFALDHDLAAGKQVVAVRFADQGPHEHFLGHDVHLARLADDTDLDRLAAWMNWMDPAGLETPAPAEFIAGAQDMPAGSTAYISLDLAPGRYAWIAEVPNPQAKGMLKVFTVPATDAPAS